MKIILQEIMKKNTWNIRRLVAESFVPSTQRIILKIVGFLVEEGHIFVKLIFCNHLSIEMISKVVQYSELPQT